MRKKTLIIRIALALLSVLLIKGGIDLGITDALNADNKIYVVVAVVATIFAGIIVYLINLDSKISKLEKQIKK
jgi:CcmD family protein